MTKTAWGLSGNQLKLIALITMTIDHIGAYIFPHYPVLRIIGRLAMPIYAFLIAEGCYHTKNKLKYWGLMAGFALVWQLFSYFFLHSLKLCILVTFSLSMLLIFSLQYVQKKKNFLSCLLFFALLAGIYWVSNNLSRYVPGCSIDYGFKGILLPVFISLGTNKQQKVLGAAVGAFYLALGKTSQWYSLLALPLLMLYSGQRGKGNYKYLFYIYYPLHLLGIHGLNWILNHTDYLAWLQKLI